jgi:class 3 adenylate cyclase
MIANVLRIPLQSLITVPIEAILFHPTIISLFAEEIKQIPIKSSTRKKTLFKSWAPQLGNMFGEGSWDFAMNDYLTFAKDLRRSEIIAFLRNRIRLVNKHRHTRFSSSSSKRLGKPISDGIADRISYQFDKGRIIYDLRNVTLAFLDLRGFTELSAGDISDQELKEQLYAFFDPVGNIINHFEGTIKTYAGDGILASFGAQKGHALNAVRAAVEIQKLFHILKHEGKIAFTDLGIGIHSGLVEETYFFSDAETSSHNTVIGLTANLVGRLSSGKTEKKRPQFDTQSFRALRESVEAYAYKSEMTPTTIAIFEDQLFHAVETIKKQQAQDVAKRRGQQELSVKVISGVLNNNGIAISKKTFQHIHALQTLQEIEIPGRVQYTFFDPILQEQILLAKAGDATFKGIEEKIPVWGVYLYRHSRP